MILHARSAWQRDAPSQGRDVSRLCLGAGRVPFTLAPPDAWKFAQLPCRPCHNRQTRKDIFIDSEEGTKGGQVGKGRRTASPRPVEYTGGSTAPRTSILPKLGSRAAAGRPRPRCTLKLTLTALRCGWASTRE